MLYKSGRVGLVTHLARWFKECIWVLIIYLLFSKTILNCNISRTKISCMLCSTSMFGIIFIIIIICLTYCLPAFAILYEYALSVLPWATLVGVCLLTCRIWMCLLQYVRHLVLILSAWETDIHMPVCRFPRLCYSIKFNQCVFFVLFFL